MNSVNILSQFKSQDFPAVRKELNLTSLTQSGKYMSSFSMSQRCPPESDSDWI
jgi:hypothetical protein